MWVSRIGKCIAPVFARLGHAKTRCTHNHAAPRAITGRKHTGSSPEGAAGPKVSPVMAQYSAIKAQNPGSLLFYRMGDFYELFFEDAGIAARALGIVLTKRGKHEGRDIPMCGVPVERAEDYLNRLIGQGHRVAVCEQVEDPAEARKRGAKSVVRREVVRSGDARHDYRRASARPRPRQ